MRVGHVKSDKTGDRGRSEAAPRDKPGPIPRALRTRLRPPKQRILVSVFTLLSGAPGSNSSSGQSTWAGFLGGWLTVPREIPWAIFLKPDEAEIAPDSQRCSIIRKEPNAWGMGTIEECGTPRWG